MIGGGPSGTDLMTFIQKTASRVTISRRKHCSFVYNKRFKNLQAKSKKNVTFQGELKRLTSTGAEFSDGSHQTFTVVIYATGLEYIFHLNLNTIALI